MRIVTKLVVRFLAIVFLIWVVTYFASNTYGKIHEEFAELKENIIPGAIAMTEMYGTANQIAHRTMEYILTADAEAKADVLAAGEGLENSLAAYIAYGKDIGHLERKEAEKLEGEGKKFISVAREILDLRERGVAKDVLLRKVDEELHPALHPFVEHVIEHRAEHMEELAEAEEAVHEAHSSGLRLLLLLAGLITLTVGAIVFFTARSIVKPIHALHRGTEIIGKGNLDYRVGTGAKDEIGQLSRAFDKMTANLKNTTASMDDLDREISVRRQVEGELKQYTRDLSERIKELNCLYGVSNLVEKPGAAGGRGAEAVYA